MVYDYGLIGAYSVTIIQGAPNEQESETPDLRISLWADLADFSAYPAVGHRISFNGQCYLIFAVSATDSEGGVRINAERTELVVPSL